MIFLTVLWVAFSCFFVLGFGPWLLIGVGILLARHSALWSNPAWSPVVIEPCGRALHQAPWLSSPVVELAFTCWSGALTFGHNRRLMGASFFDGFL